MRRWFASVVGGAALLGVVGVHLAAPPAADAFIHEIIAAMCRAGGEEVIPPGQVRGGQSEVRALIASGFITSIETQPTEVIIHFNPDVPQSKFISAGFDLTIPNGAGPGIALTLSPLIIPDPNFPAHANCHNLR